MGLLDAFLGARKVRSAVGAALRAAREQGVAAALGEVEALGPKDRCVALCAVADHFRGQDDDASAHAALKSALAHDPDHPEALERMASLGADRGDLEEALQASGRLVRAAPHLLEPVCTHAGLLLDAGRPLEALEVVEASAHAHEPAVALKRGEALLALDRSEEALEVLTAVRDHYDRVLRVELHSGDEWRRLREIHDEASRLADAATAELHGSEAVAVRHAALGKLDGRAGVNYRLLAESLMVGAKPLATEHLALASPLGTMERAERMLAADPESAHALSLKASALLRLGRVAAAHELFEKACALDGRCFSAFLGLGAVLDHERYDLFGIAGGLPQFAEPAQLLRVVPDLPALTPVERRVVVASAHSLERCLPEIAAAGACIRLLPIDVRATDLPDLDRMADERARDHRAYEALGGLAVPRLAVARVDELLDVVSDGGLVFAHELAHLAFFHLAAEQRAEVESLFERAAEVGWVAEAYALENPDEFFAVSYADWLRERLDLPRRREPDELGIHDALGQVFAALARG